MSPNVPTTAEAGAQTLDFIRSHLSWLASDAGGAERTQYAACALAELSTVAKNRALSMLASSLATCLRDFVSLLTEDVTGSSEQEVAAWLNEVGIQFLSDFGAAGDWMSDAFRDWVEKCEETEPGVAAWGVWDPSNPEGTPFVHNLTQVLWRDEVAPHLETLRTPALSLAVVSRFGPAFWNKNRRVVGREIRLANSTARAAKLGVELSPGRADALLRATRTLAGHRLLRMIVFEVFASKYGSSARDYRKLVFPGGLEAVAGRLGLAGDKAAAEVRDALHLMQIAHLDLPNGEVGGLLTWSLRRSAPGKPASLEIVVGDPLLPDFISSLPKGTGTKRLARTLVPFPLNLPPLVGAPLLHAPQAVLQVLVLRELRLGAEELLREGSVFIPEERWAALFQEAELGTNHLERVLAAWTEESEGATPFLRHLGNWRFTLADEFRAEFDLLLQGAERSRRGRDRQSRSRRAEEKGLRRRSRKKDRG